MTKRMIVVVPLFFVLMVATTASPMPPSVPAPTTPATCESPVPDAGFGACRWYCGSKSYATQSQCQANCSTQCEDIC